jgi:hypothetical protein
VPLVGEFFPFRTLSEKNGRIRTLDTIHHPRKGAMNFSSLPASPAALKSVNPYLQRAKEMEKVDPVISYWC